MQSSENRAKRNHGYSDAYQDSGLQEDLLGLLWAMEEAHVYGLAENMPLDRFHYVCASLEGVSPGLDIDLCV